jgi:NAD+ synthase
VTIHPWLSIDLQRTVAALSGKLKEAVFRQLSKKGAVVAISGGIDSSVCAALSVAALGKQHVFGLLLPEKDSSSGSQRLGESVCEFLGIPHEVKNISPVLEAIGCYDQRDSAIRKLFPEYSVNWKNKIVISRNSYETDRLNFFRLVVESPDGNRSEKRLPLKEYLQIVAATSFKQRIRKTLEYFHADRLNYAVVGTPNRLEYDQGFFVRNGDGAADVKPIAHLYKSQVYELGRHLKLPDLVVSASPTTDTYSLEQGQDEFYFSLPYDKMDLVLFGLNHGKGEEEVSRETGLSPEQVRRANNDILGKRRTTRQLHWKPLLLESVPEVNGNTK